MKLSNRTVSVEGLHTDMWHPLFTLDAMLRQHLGYELVITSGVDSKHSVVRSDHYTGTAIDMRTWTTAISGIQLYKTDRAELLKRVRVCLGSDFIVLDEANHFHMSYRPVYKA